MPMKHHVSSGVGQSKRVDRQSYKTKKALSSPAQSQSLIPSTANSTSRIEGANHPFWGRKVSLQLLYTKQPPPINVCFEGLSVTQHTLIWPFTQPPHQLWVPIKSAFLWSWWMYRNN